MSEYFRKLYNIPDEYTRDGKLTLWFQKHLHMQELEGVYLRDVIGNRGTLTKTGCVITNEEALLVFKNNTVLLDISEFLEIRSNWK
jgi:hypothetical protein